jgi:hypothetical protein
MGVALMHMAVHMNVGEVVFPEKLFIGKDIFRFTAANDGAIAAENMNDIGYFFDDMQIVGCYDNRFSGFMGVKEHTDNRNAVSCVNGHGEIMQRPDVTRIRI